MTNSQTPFKQALDEALELQKGGLKELPSSAPANQDHYFTYVHMDYETEDETTVKLNFEQRRRAILAAHKQEVDKAVVRELERLDKSIFAEPCEPDCDEVRHAKHEGSWQQHLNDRQLIAARLAELRKGKGDE